MAVTINGVRFLTTAAELSPHHLFPGADNIACPDCGLLRIAEPTAHLFGCVRDKIGPLDATSGSRCAHHQAVLAQTLSVVAHNVIVAPHVLCVALDVSIPEGYTHRSLRDVFHATSAGLFGQPARIGWNEYAQQGIPIIHVDFAWMLTPNPDSLNYQPGVEW